MMSYELHQGDALTVLKTLPSNSIQVCVTSPPYYGLRSYLDASDPDKPLEIGTEETPEAYVAKLVDVFREVRRLLTPSGVLFLNLGDTHQEKQLLGIPWRVAFALQADGWILRSEIIWAKKAPMPESVTDRPTKAHEQVFLLAKNATYYYDADAVKEPVSNDSLTRYAREKDKGMTNDLGHKYDFNPLVGGGIRNQHGARDYLESGRNKRSVWTLGPESFSGTTQTSRLERVERNALSDDTICKVSQGCPVHAGLFDWAATDSYDVPIVDLLPRTARKRDRRAPKLTFDSAPIRQPHGAATVAESSDLPLLPYSLFATDHSNGNHKTAPDPVTNPPYIASGQTPDRIDDMSSEHDSDAPSQNKLLSNKVEGVSASSGLLQIPDRNADMYELPDSFSPLYVPPECTCSFYHEITDNSSHFAVMPTKLVEPCILAGSSSYGCCAKCLAPYERVVERMTTFEGGSGKAGRTAEDANANGKWAGKQYGENIKLGPVVHTTTVDWQPSCTCNCADVIPCTVLDPFAGSGTTLAVALKHHRNAIGIDLNADYLELAHQRIERSQPMLLDVTA